jgi:hypothetical protein
MDYNTQRELMIIAEYGRHLHNMVQDCVKIEDRQKRTRTAEFIVNVMAQMNPKVKESGDYRQKLWDHLFIISDFQLDVDSPFPPPSKEVLHSKPRQFKNQQASIRYRHYGKYIEQIIEKASLFEEGPEKDALIKTIANHLKKSYLNWNKNTVDDDVILSNLAELSRSRLRPTDEFKLSHTNEILARNKKKKFTKPGQVPFGSSNGNQGNNFNKPRKKNG